MFTFMLAAVTRIYWFMLQQEHGETTTTVDIAFQKRWMGHIAAAAEKIKHHELGYVHVSRVYIYYTYTCMYYNYWVYCIREWFIFLATPGWTKFGIVMVRHGIMKHKRHPQRCRTFCEGMNLLLYNNIIDCIHNHGELF